LVRKAVASPARGSALPGAVRFFSLFPFLPLRGSAPPLAPQSPTSVPSLCPKTAARSRLPLPTSSLRRRTTPRNKRIPDDAAREHLANPVIPPPTLISSPPRRLGLRGRRKRSLLPERGPLRNRRPARPGCQAPASITNRLVLALPRLTQSSIEYLTPR
jgi:hypothetical protein